MNSFIILCICVMIICAYSPPHIYYFAYGHNTNSKVMLDRVPGATFAGVATLPNYKMVMREFANLEKSPGDSASGVLWKMTKQDLTYILDKYEGLYNHKKVRVYGKDTSYLAYAYFMKPCAWYLPPSAEYVHGVQMGYAEHNIRA